MQEDDTSDSIKERIKGILERGLHPQPQRRGGTVHALGGENAQETQPHTGRFGHEWQRGNIEAGLFKVHLQYTSTRKPCQTKSWFHVLATTVRENFGCKSYFTVKAGSRCFFGFYGIAATRMRRPLPSRLHSIAYLHSLPSIASPWESTTKSVATGV